jgi:Arc/MetJ-type ribon-helix-helix transcriptional regulator
MKTIEAKISQRLDRQIDALVEHGWFDSRDKVLQEAIRRFLEAHRPELMERYSAQKGKSSTCGEPCHDDRRCSSRNDS